MAIDLMSAMEALARRTGWRIPDPDESGKRAFFLEDGLSLSVIFPDERRLVCVVDLGAAPGADGPEGEAYLLRIGERSAGVIHCAIGIPAIRDDRFELQTVMDLARLDNEGFLTRLENFLNEAARWKAFTDDFSLPASGSHSPSSAALWFDGLRL